MNPRKHPFTAFAIAWLYSSSRHAASRQVDLFRYGALFRLFAAITHEAHFALAEIGVGYGLLITHDTQLRKQRRQLAGVKHDTCTDGSTLRRVTMEAFYDQNTAGFEGSLDGVR